MDIHICVDRSVGIVVGGAEVGMQEVRQVPVFEERPKTNSEARKIQCNLLKLRRREPANMTG